jgi:cation transport ATPase
VLLVPCPQQDDWRQWCYLALVVLVTACPCALVISTPVASVCGLARAAKQVGVCVGVGVGGPRLLWLIVPEARLSARRLPFTFKSEKSRCKNHTNAICCNADVPHWCKILHETKTTGFTSAPLPSNTQGVVARGALHLETLGRVGALTFDKSGTLTAGHFQVIAVQPLSGDSPAEAHTLSPSCQAPPGPDEVGKQSDHGPIIPAGARHKEGLVEAGRMLSLAAALEVHSSHPMAAAIVGYAAAQQAVHRWGAYVFV